LDKTGGSMDDQEKIKSRARHNAWIAGGFVLICNDQDDYYYQVFKSRKALDILINKLIALRDECFPKEN
jgi:hypothetical protein